MKKQTLPPDYYSLLHDYGLEEMSKEHLLLLTYEKNEFLCHEGCPISFLYLILKGKAKVSTTAPNGKSLLLAFYTSGILGEVEFLSDSVEATTTVQAITQFVCIGIPLSLYHGWLKNSIPFLNYAGCSLAQKLDRCSKSFTANILQPLEPRLCSYISIVQEDGFFSCRLTELSQLLGTSYRHLLRTLEHLCTLHILKKENTGYQIIAPDLLLEKSDDYYYGLFHRT